MSVDRPIAIEDMDIGRLFAQYLFLGKASEINTTLSVETPGKEEFLEILQLWFEELCSKGNVNGVKQCMETAIDVYGQWKLEILKATSKVLMEYDLPCEALKLFKIIIESSVKSESELLDVQEDYEQIINSCIPRWHYRMLNDVKRNRSYLQALRKCISNGCQDIIDIGAGSGILSLFAASCGSRSVLAFEVSPLLFQVANDVVSSSAFPDKITLLNKMSTDCTFNEIKKRPDLAVMEVFDGGLFGEGVIPTLKHALTELLNLSSEKNPESGSSVVIPKSATVFATLIESTEIRNHSRSEKTILGMKLNSVALLGRRDPEDATEQPYTTENLKCIKNGYRCLSKPTKLIEINFNDLQELTALTGCARTINVQVTASGIFDAVAVWFELQLDEEIHISSSPDADSCWEQAIFNVHLENNVSIKDYHVVNGSSVDLMYRCSDQYLQIIPERIHGSSCSEKQLPHIKIGCTDARVGTAELSESHTHKIDNHPCGPTGKREETSKRDTLSTARCTERCKYFDACAMQEEDSKKLVASCVRSNGQSYHHGVCTCELLQMPGSREGQGLLKLDRESTSIPVNRRRVSRINDVSYCLAYRNAIAEAVNSKAGEVNSDVDVLFICEDVSLLPLFVKETEKVQIDVVAFNCETELFLTKAAEENGIPVDQISFLRKSLPEVVLDVKKYDVIVTEIIEENGLIYQRYFDDIVMTRMFLLKANGVLIPEKLVVHGRLVHSTSIESDNFIRNAEVTMGFDIGRHMKEYQVSTHPDVNMADLLHENLTDEFDLFSVDLTEGENDDELSHLKSPMEVERKVTALESGDLSAIAYWFTIVLCSGHSLSTKACFETHWHQSLAVIKDKTPIKAGNDITLRIAMNRGNIHINKLSIA